MNQKQKDRFVRAYLKLSNLGDLGVNRVQAAMENPNPVRALYRLLSREEDPAATPGIYENLMVRALMLYDDLTLLNFSLGDGELLDNAHLPRLRREQVARVKEYRNKVTEALGPQIFDEEETEEDPE